MTRIEKLKLVLALVIAVVFVGALTILDWCAGRIAL